MSLFFFFVHCLPLFWAAPARTGLLDELLALDNARRPPGGHQTATGCVVMRTLALLLLATQGLSLQLPARPHLRKSGSQAAPVVSEAYQLLPYRAFGLIMPLWIVLSTENAEALTTTPRPGAEEIQMSLSSRLETSAKWRAGEKDKAETANAQMYEERSAADATRAREREARRAVVEARRLEADRRQFLVLRPDEQARAAAMQEAAAAAQERATAAKARAIAARSMSAEDLVTASAAEKVMSTEELAAAAALKAEQAAVDAEVSTTLVHALLPCNPAWKAATLCYFLGCNPMCQVAASVTRANAVVSRSREERAERQARFDEEDRETQQRVRAVTAPVALLTAGVACGKWPLDSATARHPASRASQD